MSYTEIKVADVKFREDLYPRIKTSAETVQKYAEDLDVLPPIEVNQHHELIDGWHRWTAHRKNEAVTIKAIITETRNEAEFLEFSIERNAKHGLQLSQEDKRDMARKIYHSTPEADRKTKKKELARILSVGESTVHAWLSRIDKDAKEARNQRIIDAWMRLDTQEEIAEREGLSKDAVSKICLESLTPEKLDESSRADASHASSFDVPIYNVWKWQEKSEGSKHFGNSDARVVDRLLYLYTQPFDIVVDPFAGGGSTLDVCRKRWRRCWVSDRKPIVEREKEIRKHDLTEGLPSLPKSAWKDLRLIYLDPPYWKQAEGQYSDEAEDFANMPLDVFHEDLAQVINEFGKKLHSGAHIAMILQPTQWKADGRQYTDHVAEMIQRVKLPIAMRIQAPYESQQCTAQMVEWAKENRQVLVLSREIVVWRKA